MLTYKFVMRFCVSFFVVCCQIYSIPMLLLIGWRGEPGKKDEPQHLVQGKVMSPLLTDLNIQFEVLPDYIEGAREAGLRAVLFTEPADLGEL